MKLIVLLPVSFMREMLSSFRSSYTRVPATSLRSFKRWESGAVAIWLICTKRWRWKRWNYLPIALLRCYCQNIKRTHFTNQEFIIRFKYDRDGSTFFFLLEHRQCSTGGKVLCDKQVWDTVFSPFPAWQCSMGYCGRSRHSPEGSWRHFYCNKNNMWNAWKRQ